MDKNVFERLRTGEPVNMRDADYADAVEEINRTRMAIFDINQLRPDRIKVHQAFDRLLMSQWMKQPISQPLAR